MLAPGMSKINKVKMKKRLTLLSMLLLLALTSTRCTTEAPENEIDRSRSLVAEFVEKNRLPGLSVTVSKAGKVVWSEGFGYGDLEQQVKVDPSVTLFRIGSISKTLTATAIGLLYEDNKLDIDLPVRHYVPSFPQKRWNINIRQVAGHIAGIRHYRGAEYLSNKRYATVTEGLEMFKDDSLLFEPATNYAYSSYGWNLISAALETASGMGFLQFMQQNVFEPVKMSLTTADYGEVITPFRTAFYELSKDSTVLNAPFVDNSYKWAGGGFLSTTEDLVKFGNAILTGSLLKEETIELLFTPQTISGGKSTDYGLGWRKYEGNGGGEWYGHGGGSVGGTAIFILSPKEKMVVAILSNLSDVSYNRLHFNVAENFINYQ